MRRRKPLTAEARQAKAERDEWSLRWNRCWACGRADYWQSTFETHEIVRRSETAAALSLPNYARLCRACHEECHGGWLTKGALMTLKLLLNPIDYDLDWVREHSLKKHWSPEPLPPACDWLLSDAALRERQT